MIREESVPQKLIVEFGTHHFKKEPEIAYLNIHFKIDNLLTLSRTNLKRSLKCDK